MNSIIVRDATDADAGAIADILRHTGWFAHLNAVSREEVVDQVRMHIAVCQADNSHTIYVAGSIVDAAADSVLKDSEIQVLGYAAVHWLPYLFLPAPEGYLSELFVSHQHRGQGIGKALLNEVITAAKHRGCSRLMLVNGRSRESYQRQFYIKQGWTERSDVANFIYRL